MKKISEMAWLDFWASGWLSICIFVFVTIWIQGLIGSHSHKWIGFEADGYRLWRNCGTCDAIQMGEFDFDENDAPRLRGWVNLEQGEQP